MSTAQQAQNFLTMAVVGVLLGAAYDALMLLRRGIGAGRIITGALDVFYGVFCAAGITAAALFLHTEAFRWYVFAAVGMGVSLYMVTLGTIVRFVWKGIRKIFKKSENLEENVKNGAGKRKMGQNF